MTYESYYSRYDRIMGAYRAAKRRMATAPDAFHYGASAAIAEGFRNLAVFLAWCDYAMGDEATDSVGDDSTYCPEMGGYPIRNEG